jgi:hypothetical protein
MFAALTGLQYMVFAMPVIANDSKKETQETQVIDSQGTVVGTLLSQNMVIRRINGLWVSFSLFYGGLNTAILSDFVFFHTSSDCSGQRYMDADPVPLVGYLVSTNGGLSPTATLYFAGNPIQSLVIGSYEASGQCIGNNNTMNVAPPSAINLSFVPPFSLR